MSKTVKNPKNLIDFKAAFDPDVKIPEKIRSALKSLASEGPEAWEMDRDFVIRCGTNFAMLSRYRDQFLEYIVEVPGVNTSKKRCVWFGDKRVAAKARGG